MKRVAIIIGALVAGIFGLFMSVCGGGFFIVSVFEALRALFTRLPSNSLMNGLPLMIFAGGSAFAGIVLIVNCVKKLRQAFAARVDE